VLLLLQISEESRLSAMYRSFDAVQKQSDIVVLEGTGHTAVGSIVNLNNAQVNMKRELLQHATKLFPSLYAFSSQCIHYIAALYIVAKRR
jgi:hypothetical protein